MVECAHGPNPTLRTHVDLVQLLCPLVLVQFHVGGLGSCFCVAESERQLVAGRTCLLCWFCHKWGGHIFQFSTICRIPHWISNRTTCFIWWVKLDVYRPKTDSILGLYGSLFPVFTRAVVAILWIGVTVYQSSLFLDVALRYDRTLYRDSQQLISTADVSLAMPGTRCLIPFLKVPPSLLASL